MEIRKLLDYCNLDFRHLDNIQQNRCLGHTIRLGM